MMLMVIPDTDIAMIAARRLSGMLTAATTVERMFSRKRKITSTANAAPSPPSRNSELIESMMKVEEFVTIEISTFPGWAALKSSSAAIASCAVVTVFASADFDTLTERPGLPFVSDQPEVCTSATEMVPTWLRSTGWRTPPAPTLAPTMSPFSWSSVVKRPVAETGTSAPPIGSCPAGKVRLFAWMICWTWLMLTPLAASFVASSWIYACFSTPPERSAEATPVTARRFGRSSSLARVASSSSVMSPFGLIVAITTAAELML